MKTKYITLKITAIAIVMLLANHVFAQNIQTIKTFHDPWTKTQLSEVYTVIQNTPTKHGNYKKYDERGTLIEDKNFSNGQLNGTSKTYYNAFLAQVYDNPKDWYGKIAEILNYSKGELNGNAEEYHYLYGKQQLKYQRVYSNGAMTKNTEYHNNGNKKISVQLNGVCNEWHENGQKSAEYNYKNGEADGQYTAWHENGNVAGKGIFKNGNKFGKWTEYYPDGKVFTENDHNDEFISTKKSEYFPSGGIKGERYLVKDDIYKEIRYDSISGNKTLDADFKFVTVRNEVKLVKNGKELLFYPNGAKKSETNYLALYETNFYAERKHGEYIEWFENGKTKTQGKYDKDRMVGIWSTFHENGNKESEINYVQNDRPPYNSVKDGDSKTYYSNGNIKSEGKYKNGYENGLWSYYKESGELDYVEDEFKDGSYSSGRKKKTKEQLDIEKAHSEYKENSQLISQKFDKINQLYEVTTSQVDNPNNWMAPKVTVYTPNKKKNLYNAFLELDKYLKSLLSDGKPMTDNLEISKQRIKLYVRMIELINTDTKEMEKSLKKESDPEKIKQIIGY